MRFRIKHFQFRVLLVLFLFFQACANIISPTGGEQDITPPMVISSEPENFSPNFASKRITITFDEFFQLGDVFSEVLISPPLKHDPKIQIRKKTLSITLYDTLLPNTTYSINFGDAISDITESNILENYQYVFSTGTYVDSLSISGLAKYAFTHEAEKGILIMLYNDHADSVVQTSKPYYFTRTDEDGQFRISHIRGGVYKLFALKDQNLNFLFDLPNEDIAFPDNLIKISDKESDSTIQLYLFQEDKGKQIILKHDAKTFAKIRLRFSRKADSIKLMPLSYDGYFECITQTDTIHCWLDDIYLESLDLQVSNNTEILDTLTLNIPSIPRDSVLSAKLFIKPPWKKSQKVKRIDINKPLLLKFQNPVLNFDFNQLTLLEDSDQVKVNPQPSWNDSIKRSLSIFYDWKPGTIYKLVVDSASFEDIYHTSNDSLILRFRSRAKVEYGNLKLLIQLTDSTSNYFLELFQKDKIIKKSHLSFSSLGAEASAEEALNSAELKIDYLHPGVYKIRVVQDSNKNGKWDTGDYLKHRQPESIFYYPEEINLRANWEMELDFDISKSD